MVTDLKNTIVLITGSGRGIASPGTSIACPGAGLVSGALREDLFRGAIELDGAYEVAAGVLEEQEMSYLGNGRALEHDGCAVLA